MSGLEEMVADYLTVRRSLGYKLAGTEHLLGQFVAYLHHQDEQTLTVEHALAFATAPVDASRRWQALRLSAIRCFARWAQPSDASIQVPPTRLLPTRPSRATPYIYTAHEVAALLGATDQLRPPIRAATFRTLIGLMAATGIRTGEMIGLDIVDLDQQAETLTVTGKYARTRRLPLHPSVAEALVQYLDLRNRLLPAGACPALLISTRGARLHPSTVHRTFRGLVAEVGLRAVSPACRPRLHDFRHTFAVSTMLDAYTSGDDPAVVLPLLSTWLGHIHPSDTYWYLTGTAELMAAAADRLERRQGQHRGDLQ